MRRWFGAPVARVIVAGVLLVGAGACIRPPVRGLGLETFANCDGLLRYLKDAALARVGPYGLSGGGYYRGGPVPDGPVFDHDNGGTPRPTTPPTTRAPSPPSGGSPTTTPGHSGTNVQEVGVDEPDTVKTDGKRLLAVANGRVNIVDLTGAMPKLVGSVPLPYGNAQLLLQGNHLLMIANQWSYYPMPVMPRPPIGAPPTTGVPGRPIVYRPSIPGVRLTLVDIADGTRPAVLSDVLVDGSLVDARLVGGRARVVTNAAMRALPWVTPADYTDASLLAAQRANEDIIRQSTATDWLPKVRPATAATEPAAGTDLMACGRVSHPPTFSGFDTVSVLSLDLARPAIDTTDTVAVTATGQSVYASTRNLFVATRATTDTTYTGRIPDGPVRPVPPPTDTPVFEPRTALHGFDVTTAGPATYKASGTVDGAVLNQWSMSEHNGYLRVVTTLGTSCGGCNGEQSQLSVLRISGTSYPVVGTVSGMGKGEAVKSVRFIGDRGYVVTFRQVDPLYVLDLRNPAKPVVAGELKVPGYSAYLHPVGDGQLLGVGRDATPEGRVTGTKVSLYDVADPTKPAEVRSIALPDSYTSVEYTAKAFLWWEPSRFAAVPVTTYGRVIDASGQYVDSGFTGVIGLDVTAGSLTERGRVTNESSGYGLPDIERSAVVGDRLLTVSSNGVRFSDLASLAPQAWVAFTTG